MKSITECALYQLQNRAINITERMTNYNEITDRVNAETIDDHLQIIKKRFTFPLKTKTLSLFEAGYIQVAYNESKQPIPSYVPCYLMVNPKTKQPMAVCNVTLIGNMNRERTNLTINTRQLYTVMQTGAITLGCLNNWNAVSMNQTICKLGAEIYSKIFTKVLDRMFAINLDVNKTDILKFKSAEFFLKNVLGKTNENNIHNIAYACTSGETSLNYLNQFDSIFTDSNGTAYKSFENFIEALSEKVEGLGELNLRSYLDNYMRMYGVSTLFALEYFPAFTHMISSMVIGAHLNAEHVIENLVGRLADKFIVELCNIIK